MKTRYMYLVCDGRANPDNWDDAICLEALGDFDTDSLALAAAKEGWTDYDAHLVRYKDSGKEGGVITEETYLCPVDIPWREWKKDHG